MIDFYHTDAAGVVVQQGQCVDDQIEHQEIDGLTMHLGRPETIELPQDESAIAIARRNYLLMRSDWTQLPDVPITTKTEWSIYRQALRDITDQPDFPSIVWPTPPP